MMTAPSPPVGPPVDATPARLPGDVTLKGRFGTVERLDPARHGATMWDAMRGHDGLWAYNPFGPFPEAVGFSSWLAERAKVKDPLYYSIVDVNGRATGIATLMEIRPNARVIEVGHICYSPALQRTPLGTEAQYLLMATSSRRWARHEWKCTAQRAVWRAALRRLQHEGELPHMIVRVATATPPGIRILDEWPARRPRSSVGWRRRTSRNGGQKVSLAALNGAG